MGTDLPPRGMYSREQKPEDVVVYMEQLPQDVRTFVGRVRADVADSNIDPEYLRRVFGTIIVNRITSYAGLKGFVDLDFAETNIVWSPDMDPDDGLDNPGDIDHFDAKYNSSGGLRNIIRRKMAEEHKVDERYL